MKTTAIFVAIVCGMVAAIGAAISQVPVMVLGLLGALATMIWFGMSISKQHRMGSSYEQLDPELRTFVRPIKKLHDDLQKTAQTTGNTTAKVIAQEAVIEGTTILANCIKLVEIRADIKKSLYGRSEANADLQDLQEKLSRAEGNAELGALAAAIEAREKESAHYATMETSLEKIDATLRQAEASLAEIKARLAVAMASPEGAESRQQELEETMTRLRALSVSFDEAEDLLEGRTV